MWSYVQEEEAGAGTCWPKPTNKGLTVFHREGGSHCSSCALVSPGSCPHVSVERQLSHDVTRHTSHVTRHTSHVTRHTGHLGFDPLEPVCDAVHVQVNTNATHTV